MKHKAAHRLMGSDPSIDVTVDVRSLWFPSHLMLTICMVVDYRSHKIHYGGEDEQ